jgi:hypothetical protein
VFEYALVHGQFGKAGFGVTVRTAISSDRSERSGVVATEELILASARHGRAGFGVTVRYAIMSERSERSGVSTKLLLTLPVVPMQQELETDTLVMILGTYEFLPTMNV